MPIGSKMSRLPPTPVPVHGKPHLSIDFVVSIHIQIFLLVSYVDSLLDQAVIVALIRLARGDAWVAGGGSGCLWVLTVVG
uniref:Uncharacterized protein n=1 Tax=Kalanchoe fedtschenkoi TaxID=63787 RepID=A0A7N0V644_KALFE